MPEKILVLTFTRDAAISMKERYLNELSQCVKQFNVSQAVKQNNVSQTVKQFYVSRPVNFGTFHSIFYQILKSSTNLQDYQILTEADKRKILLPILEKTMPELNYLERNQLGMELIPAISYYKNVKNEAEATARLPKEAKERFLDLFTSYERRRKEAGKLDFDDMLTDCHALFLNNPEIREKWQSRFDHVLIDEFQDVNPAQYEVIKLLTKDPWNVFAVGDDDQSIYGFRGADPSCMKRFAEEFHAKTITLNVNYRSHGDIVKAANQLIGHNRERFPKKIVALEDHNKEKQVLKVGFAGRREEDGFLLERCKQFLAEKGDHTMGILFRTNRGLQRHAATLRRAGIDFMVKEKLQNPYRQEYCLDVHSYLCLAHKMDEIRHLTKIVNRPSRYVSREMIVTATRMEGNAASKEQVNAVESLIKAYENKDPQVAEKLEMLQKQLNTLRKLSPFTAVQYVRKVVGYDRWILDQYGNHLEKRQEAMEILDWLSEEAKDCDDVEEFLGRFEETSRHALTEEKTNESVRRSGITLMTVHGAKGLEFDQVILPDVNERNFPHGVLPDQKTLEEERRVFYVGMTRAKKKLWLLYLQKDVGNVGEPSRFLKEIK